MLLPISLFLKHGVLMTTTTMTRLMVLRLPWKTNNVWPSSSHWLNQLKSVHQLLVLCITIPSTRHNVMLRQIGLTRMAARLIMKTELLNSLQLVNTMRNTVMRQETTSLSVLMTTTFKTSLPKSSRKKSIQNQTVSQSLMLK